jgi:hypothetical protein
MSDGAFKLEGAWIGVQRNPLGRLCAWEHPQLVGVRVRHCGHPTALRPYYIIGCDTPMKFRLLKQAQQAAEELIAEALAAR